MLSSCLFHLLLLILLYNRQQCTSVNGTTSTQTSIIILGIITCGVGTQNSSLTIPGNPKLNNTTVICIASGYVNNVGNYINSSSATFFIQSRCSMLPCDSK